MLRVWRAVARLGCGWPDWTLIAYSPALRLAEAGAAFATPRIVHFGVVLLLSAVASVPWHKISVVWGLVRLSGIVYGVVVARRLRVQAVYQPVFEDW